MTHNQIEYWKMQYDRAQRANELAENKRANLERERLTEEAQREVASNNRRNYLLQQAEQSRKRLADQETARMNSARETFNLQSLANSANQSIQDRSERRRSSIAAENNTRFSNITNRLNTINQARSIDVQKSMNDLRNQTQLKYLQEQRRSNNLNYEVNTIRNQLQMQANAVQAQNVSNQYYLGNQSLLQKQNELNELKRHNETSEYINVLSTIGRIANMAGRRVS